MYDKKYLTSIPCLFKEWIISSVLPSSYGCTQEVAKHEKKRNELDDA